MKLIPFCFVFLIIVNGAYGQGRGRPELSGEIELEESEAPKDAFVQGQSEAISFFRQMEERVAGLRSGSAAAQAEPSGKALNYLTGVYLFCVGNSGKCPLVLEALLEADIINSKLQGAPSCPILKAFWSHWVRNGMEERQNYLIKTGSMEVFRSFESNERPRFLQCEKTVGAELSGGPASSTEFFRSRYANDARPGLLARKMRTFLEALKQRGINVFIATGAITESAQDPAAPPSKAPAQAPPRTGRR